MRINPVIREHFRAQTGVMPEADPYRFRAWLAGQSRREEQKRLNRHWSADLNRELGLREQIRKLDREGAHADE